jgi:inner membrane protein
LLLQPQGVSGVDPLSQGAIGAALPQSIEVADRQVHARQLLLIGVMGFLSGMAPDLDIFIRSPEDPLLFLEFHRQFTHALVFIPVGGFLCGLLAYRLFARKAGLTFLQVWLYCTLGYATHGFLDSCTSYGTQLFWPFTNYRVSWNTISIVDPLFTLPIVLMVVLAAFRKKILFARLAVAWIFLYMGFGLFQQQRAQSYAEDLMAQRGESFQRMLVKPTFANTILFKVLVEKEHEYEMFSVRVGLDTLFYAGDSMPKLDIVRDFPWLEKNSQQAKDIQRFGWFSDGYLGLNPDDSSQIMDARYTPTPNRFTPLWRIELSENAGPDDHVAFITTRSNTEEDNRLFLDMLLGRVLN